MSKLLEKIMNYKNDKDVQEAIKSILKFTEVNGFKKVDNDFISKIESMSILDFAKKYPVLFGCGEIHYVHLRKAVLDTANEFNQDILISLPFDKYCERVEMSGFTEIASFNLNNKESKLYIHNQHSILWSVSNGGQSQIYFNGKLKDGVDYLDALSASRHYVYGTDVISYSLSAVNNPLLKIETILTQFIIQKNIIDLSVDSCFFKDIDKRLKSEKLTTFEKDSFENIFQYNIKLDIEGIREEQELFRDINFNTFQLKINAFNDSLSENERLAINAYAKLTKKVYNDGSYFSDEMIEKISQFGFEDNEMDAVIYQFCSWGNKLQNPFTDINASLALLSDDQREEYRALNNLF